MRRVLIAGGMLLAAYVLAVFCYAMFTRNSRPASHNRAVPQPITIYAPIEDMAVARSASYLDSSPLLSPANFGYLPANTEVVVVGNGGLLPGQRMYTEFTGDGENKGYIYKDIFDQKFRKVRTYTPKR